MSMNNGDETMSKVVALPKRGVLGVSDETFILFE